METVFHGQCGRNDGRVQLENQVPTSKGHLFILMRKLLVLKKTPHTDQGAIKLKVDNCRISNL